MEVVEELSSPGCAAAEQWREEQIVHPSGASIFGDEVELDVVDVVEAAFVDRKGPDERLQEELHPDKVAVGHNLGELDLEQCLENHVVHRDVDNRLENELLRNRKRRIQESYRGQH